MVEVFVIGFGKRVSFAFRSFFSLLGSGTLPDEVVREVAAEAAAPAIAAAPAPKPVPESPDRAIQLLALFQRDGRLVDFLSEEIAPYTDEQVGAAARAVHESCREVLGRYFTLEPVMVEAEGDRVTVQAGFDAASIKVLGSVAGQPPIRGVLRHRGWRVAASTLPPLADGEGRAVVAPAEVEVS